MKTKKEELISLYKIANIFNYICLGFFALILLIVIIAAGIIGIIIAVFYGIILVPTILSIVYVNKSIKEFENNIINSHVVLGVLTLLFANLIGGILILVAESKISDAKIEVLASEASETIEI